MAAAVVVAAAVVDRVALVEAEAVAEAAETALAIAVEAEAVGEVVVAIAATVATKNHQRLHDAGRVAPAPAFCTFRSAG